MIQTKRHVHQMQYVVHMYQLYKKQFLDNQGEQLNKSCRYYVICHKELPSTVFDMMMALWLFLNIY